MDYVPDRHYGRASQDRPDYTPCGKLAKDVVITYELLRVTCPVCLEELATAQAVS